MGHVLYLGMINAPSSPWSSRVNKVKHKAKKTHLCCAFGQLNLVGVIDPYSLPRLNSHQNYAKQDGAPAHIKPQQSGRFPGKKQGSPKIVFECRLGSLEPEEYPLVFATKQRFSKSKELEVVLKKQRTGSNVMSCKRDIMAASKTVKNHLVHMTEDFFCVRDADQKSCNSAKCDILNIEICTWDKRSALKE